MGRTYRCRNCACYVVRILVSTVNFLEFSSKTHVSLSNIKLTAEGRSSYGKCQDTENS